LQPIEARRHIKAGITETRKLATLMKHLR
jgi:hypothetical protein